MESLLTSSQTNAAFQLKADFVPLTVMRLQSADLDNLAQQLTSTFRKAPNYLDQAPVIIDVTELKKQNIPFDLNAICSLAKTHGFIPVGIRGLSDDEYKAAEANHLANMSRSKKIPKTSVPAVAEEEPLVIKSSSLIIDKPIRAGSQVYAKGGDLIVLCSVNPGAEILADGSIHVYGQLRGKAIAGAKGDLNAQVFCRSVDADLVSIAGYYLMDAVNKPADPSATIHIHLKNKKIVIKTL